MPSISTQDDVTNAQQENAQNSINKIKNEFTIIGVIILTYHLLKPCRQQIKSG